MAEFMTIRLDKDAQITAIRKGPKLWSIRYYMGSCSIPLVREYTSTKIPWKDVKQTITLFKTVSSIAKVSDLATYFDGLEDSEPNPSPTVIYINRDKKS